jgi:asparagine synthase (glutamine-hydrolysing)
MVRIVGLQGSFNGNLLNSMLNSLRHRNYLSTKCPLGLFVSSGKSTIFNNKLCKVDLNENKYNIGLGSVSLNPQPIKYKDLILVFDGTIYNSSEINNILEEDEGTESDGLNKDNALLIAKLLYKFFIKSLDLKETVIKASKIMDGEYAFAVFDGENLAIARDSLGIRPLYYIAEMDNSDLDIDSTLNKYNSNLKSFSSEKKALWNIANSETDIQSLKPGHILYNWKLLSPAKNPWDYNKEPNMDYNHLKIDLLTHIRKSLYKRVADLNEVGLIFSGGVDSSILANLLKEASLNLNDLKVKLYTVGVENSKDLEYSLKVAKKLNLNIETRIIDEKTVRNSLVPVLEAIEEPNIMKIGVGMTLYLATKMAANDNISVVLAGQGADELFGGYNRYLTTLNETGYDGVELELVHDIKHGYEVNFERDDKIAHSNGVELRVPYLDENLVNFSLKIPVKYKIYSDEDKLRKRILRDLAIDIGLDEDIAMRPKKAAQYGSGIHKILVKKVLNDTDLNKKMNNIINDYSKFK